jgi:hypothetical protein
MTANTTTSTNVRAVVVARTLRKLRTRNCSRSAAELAPRTTVTMLPRR